MGILSDITDYAKRTWKNGKTGKTAVSAAPMNHIEEGIAQNREYIKALNEGKADVDGDVKFSSVNTKTIKSEDKDGANETLEFISDGVGFESTDEVYFKFGEYIIGILNKTIRGIGKIVAFLENGKRYLSIEGSVTVKKTEDSDGDLNIEGYLNVDGITTFNGDVETTGDMISKKISADEVDALEMNVDIITGKDSDDVKMLGGFTFEGDVEFTGNVSGTGIAVELIAQNFRDEYTYIQREVVSKYKLLLFMSGSDAGEYVYSFGASNILLLPTSLILNNVGYPFCGAEGFDIETIGFDDCENKIQIVNTNIIDYYIDVYGIK